MEFCFRNCVKEKKCMKAIIGWNHGLWHFIFQRWNSFPRYFNPSSYSILEKLGRKILGGKSYSFAWILDECMFSKLNSSIWNNFLGTFMANRNLHSEKSRIGLIEIISNNFFALLMKRDHLLIYKNRCYLTFLELVRQIKLKVNQVEKRNGFFVEKLYSTKPNIFSPNKYFYSYMSLLFTAIILHGSSYYYCCFKTFIFVYHPRI